MEKIRAFLAWLKKYHFWVLCGLILFLSLLSWFLATGDEETRFAARKGQIESKFGLASAIVNNREHPSAKYIEQIRDIERGPLTEQVDKASKHLYDEQRDANPLPKLFSTDENAQKEFKEAFERIWGPMEEIAKLPPDRQLADLYRSRYRNHIEEHFPELFELIERRTAEGGDEPARGKSVLAPGLDNKGGSESTKKMVGVVDWRDADQKIKSLVERLPNNPTTLDIMMAQEDLWVYETLLKVVRYTNNVGPDRTQYRKPPSHKMARIKEILAMDIGKDAVRNWAGSEKALFSLPSGGGSPGGEGHAPPPAAKSDHDGNPTARGLSLADRYVDDKGRPLSDSAPQPYGEFRMIPIDLKVVIEQREIPRLLAECANSAMRIDVRNVRILVQRPPAVDLTATNATGEGKTSRDAAGNQGDFVYREESADPGYQPVPVEVQGIIYIYNPPRGQNPGETAGGNGGPAVPAASPPAAGPATTPTTAKPLEPASPMPPRGGPMAPPAPGTGPAPAAAGGLANPPITTPVRGGRP